MNDFHISNFLSARNIPHPRSTKRSPAYDFETTQPLLSKLTKETDDTSAFINVSRDCFLILSL